MKIHIHEQIIEIEAGEGRIRFDLIKDAMDNEPATTPEANQSAPAETPVVKVAASEDAGIQAPASEEPKEEPVA